MPVHPLGLAAAFLLLGAAPAHADQIERMTELLGFETPKQPSPADPDDAAQVALGEALYADHCAACHGADLEGAENWRDTLDNGAYPPPPHDETGHTWHHSDKVLFEYTKLGGAELFRDYPTIVSEMPGFADTLSDADIWAVLAFIKASWPGQARQAQAAASSHDPLPDAYLPDAE